jgi:hypothetical protein
MNLLSYLSFLLAVIIILSFITCLIIQQLATYSGIIQKARKFADNNF